MAGYGGFRPAAFRFLRDLVRDNAYETPREVRVALARHFTFYNAHRPHQSLGHRTPDEIYFGTRARKGPRRRMNHGCPTAAGLPCVSRAAGHRTRAAKDTPCIASQFHI
jgi:hypothetical protein